MGQVVVDAFHLGLDLGHELVGLVLVVFQDALHLDLEQAQVVVVGDGAHQLLLEGLEALVEELEHRLLVGRLLERLLLIHALLDEDALERGEEELFHELVAAYLQFAAQQSHGVVDAVAQHLADGEKLWLAVFDDAAVG